MDVQDENMFDKCTQIEVYVMKIFNQIKSLANCVIDAGAADDGGVKEGLRLAMLCEKSLDDWYSKKEDPDFRLIKLLRNLIFYLNTHESELKYCVEIRRAIAKTLLHTADYDLNIREYPERVKERNDSIIHFCQDLHNEEKLPVEELSNKPYDMTIYMATYNQLELTKLCLDSIFQNTTDVSYELYLIDNGSSDGTYEYFKNDSRIKLIRLEENTGLLLALHIFYESGLDNGKFWMYMNNDVLATPRWASNMLKCIKSDPSIGSVLPVTNRTAAFACIEVPFGLYNVEDVQKFGEQYNVSNPKLWQDWLIYYGFVLLTRPSVRRKFGYHEDCFYFSFYYSDGDIIMSQTKAGYRAVQARDTYIHHFDGGHTVLAKRRKMLAEGEKQFFNKYGFFPTDIEHMLPTETIAKVAIRTVAKVLFLGSSRSHPIMQMKHLSAFNNSEDQQIIQYYAADTMEYLKLEQYGKDVLFQQIDNWYEVEDVFQGETFDYIIYLDDIMRLRKPDKFLSALYNRLNINGKLVFIRENTGCLLALNYILMSRRQSARDKVRIRKHSIVPLNEVLSLLSGAGFSINSIEDSFYNETFTYANMNTIENYRSLYKGKDTMNFEYSIRMPLQVIVARRSGNVDIDNTLEQLIYKKKGTM